MALQLQDITCTFCGKHQRDVARLIAGPDVYICGGCALGMAAALGGQDGAATGACAFCGKSAPEVRIASHERANVCGDCLGLVLDIVAEAAPPGAKRERVYKLHGLGNDFVVMDRRRSGQDIDSALAVSLCDRRRGIGADGVLVLLPSKYAVAKMVVHNADGSVAEMCGNGLRCAVKYLVHSPSSGRPSRVQVETGAGVLACSVEYDEYGNAGDIEIDMGPAQLVASNLPGGRTSTPFVDAPLPGHPDLRGTAVSMGNPHLVLSNGRIADVQILGPVLEHHPDFPDRTNVEFVERTQDGLRVAVWERGSGFTQACGTGACASVAAFVQRGVLAADSWILVELPGGRLSVFVASGLSSVKLRGPAEFVFTAVIEVR